MGSTNEQIANMALGHCGVAGGITNVASDQTPEGIACRIYLDVSVEEALEDFSWLESSAYGELALVEEDPNDEWGYSYRYPTDCVFAQRIVGTGHRRDPTPPAYEVGQDDQGKLIYTDKPDAVLKYTKRIVDAGRFSKTFALAISWRLAMYVAPVVTRMPGIADRLNKGYNTAIVRARARAMNEGQKDPEPEADHIQARHDAGSPYLGRDFLGRE